MRAVVSKGRLGGRIDSESGGLTRDRPELREPERLPAIFEKMDRDRVILDLREMIAIPSVNPFDNSVRAGFREQEMAAFYLERMSALGMDIDSCEVAPGRPNVWGVLKGQGDGPSLMLSGHLDTVGTQNYPDAFVAKLEGGRVYGRGSCDMKAALAGYLEVVRLVQASGTVLRGDLVVAGVVDEEHHMIGSRHLGRHGPRADYGIIGEPTDLAICPAHRGQVGFVVRIRGKACHSSRPEDGVNAIEGMCRVIEALRGYGAELMMRESHELCGQRRYSPGVIRGGTTVSTVPDFCELEVDRRTLPGETADEVRQELEAVLEALKRSCPDLNYELCGPSLDVAPLDIPVASRVVQTVKRGYRKVSGREGDVNGFVGGTDAPNFGFPTLIFGPGSVAQAHSLNEYVAIDDVILATRVYLWSVLEVLGAEQGSGRSEAGGSCVGAGDCAVLETHGGGRRPG